MGCTQILLKSESAHHKMKYSIDNIIGKFREYEDIRIYWWLGLGSPFLIPTVCACGLLPACVGVYYHVSHFSRESGHLGWY